jgi:4-alpha-glucanotransferase
MDDMSQQASARGIETEYIDADGRRRVIAPDAIARLITAIPADGEAPRRIFPSTIVVRHGRAARIKPVRRWRGSIRWEIVAQERISGGESATPRISLPPDLPVGTFDLRISFLSPPCEIETVALLVAPERAFQGDDGSARIWALAVQLYAVRSRRNWGHGDFTDLAGLIDLAVRLGAAGIGLNPLHDTTEASPYSPNSRLFLNPLYIDVESIPGFPGVTAESEQGVEALRRQTLVDYPNVRKAKLRALRCAYEAFDTAGAAADRRDLAKFCDERSPALQRFACFEVLRGRFRSPWWDWPEPWRKPNEDDLGRLQREEAVSVGFIEFVQWQADRQLRACRNRARRAGMTLGLYLDVAVGVQPEGFDAWEDQASMLPKVTIGAPPDILNTAGQNWRLAAFNPLGLEARRFTLFREVLRTSMRYAGAVRLDHVLGLKRLYLIPSGLAATDGAYVRLPFVPLMAVVAQESDQNRCIVIGEDLGTVPENFRETLADWGIWSYQVMLFEREENGAFRPPESYRENALVTFTTHDLPTFAGWTAGRDLAVRIALGSNPGESLDERAQAHRALRDALAKHGLQSSEFASVTRYLADTPARLLMIAIEDVLGIKDQINVPGTIDEQPNWRARLPVFLEDLGQESALVELACSMKAAGRCGGPASMAPAPVIVGRE